MPRSGSLPELLLPDTVLRAIEQAGASAGNAAGRG